MFIMLDSWTTDNGGVVFGNGRGNPIGNIDNIRVFVGFALFPFVCDVYRKVLQTTCFWTELHFMFCFLCYKMSRGNKMLLFCDCRDNWEALKESWLLNCNYCDQQMAAFSIRFNQPHHTLF